MGMERGGSGRVREGQGGSGIWSSENRIKVLRIEWIHSKGLGTNLGQGEVWIGVLVRCYTECNT